MPDGSFSFLMAGGVPVVTAPAEIDVTTAGQLRAMLAAWAARGHTTVVVDMTGTQFCDSGGLTVLVRAHKHALAENGELRVVLPASGTVPRVFTLTGLDQLIPHFTGLEQALAQAPDGRIRPPRPKRSPGMRGRAERTGPGPGRSEERLWRIAGSASSAAPRSCHAVSTPGFAVSAAAPPGTANT